MFDRSPKFEVIASFAVEHYESVKFVSLDLCNVLTGCSLYNSAARASRRKVSSNLYCRYKLALLVVA